MDIKAALEDIIEAMSEDIQAEFDGGNVSSVAYNGLQSARRQLRTVVKLLPTAPVAPPPPAGRFRADGKFTTKEEGYVPRQPEPQVVFDGPRMVTCDGGESDGSIAQVDGMMPDGASTLIGGDVYTLTAGRLVYNKSQTERRRERMMGVE